MVNLPGVLVTYFALYRADEAGPVDADDGVSLICVGLFTDYEEAIVVARENLAEGYSISIDVGVMPTAEWDAIEEVPDDFTPHHAPAAVARSSDRTVGDRA